MPSPVELLGDLFAVAEKKLGVPSEVLLRTVPLSELEATLTELSASFEDGDAHPSAVEVAAISAAWIIRHQPFPKFNREIAYAYMRLLLKGARARWPRLQEDARRIEAMLRALEAGLISETKFVDWVCLRVATA